MGAPSPATETALRRLVSQWCDASMRRDAGAAAELLADDAVLDIGTAISGRDAITAALQKSFAGLEWLVQLAPNAVFEVDEADGVGTGRVMVQETSRSTKGIESVSFALYEDRLRRVDGQWRFAARTRTALSRP